MLIRTAIALAFVVATASGALAAKQKQHSPNPGWDVYDGGTYLGSDPDANVRTRILHDRGRD